MNIRKFAAILALSAGSLLAQMTQMTGSVTGFDGMPVQGAEVQINRTDIKANYKIKTDKKGKFVYATLPLGTFDVTVTVEGNKVFDQHGMRTDYSKPVTINIDLQKMLQQQQAQQQQQQQQQAAAAAAAPAAPAAAPPPAPAGQTPEQAAAAQAEFEKQKKAFEEAEAKDKGLQTAFNKGMDAAKAGDLNTAIDAFKQAATFGPGQHAVWGQMADAYSKRAEKEKGAERLADYNGSADAYLKAIEIAPEDPIYRYNASIALARSNKMDDAEAQLNKAVQLDPTQAARGYRNLGAAYFDTNRIEPAQAAYKKAIELDPNDAPSHYQLAILLMQKATESNGKLNVPPGTEDELQKYMELAPTGPYAEEVKSMLQALGATVTNRITKQQPAPAKPAKGKK